MLYLDSARLPGSCEYIRASRALLAGGREFLAGGQQVIGDGWEGDALEEDSFLPVSGQAFNEQPETKLWVCVSLPEKWVKEDVFSLFFFFSPQ